MLESFDKLDANKRRELAIKQEIKNFQDSLTQVYQLINDNKNEIKKINDDFNTKLAKSESERVKLLVENDKLKQKTEDEAYQIRSSVNLLYSDVYKLKEKNSNLNEEIFKKLDLQTFQEEKKLIENNVENIQKNIYLSSIESARTLGEMISILRQEIKYVKDNIDINDAQNEKKFIEIIDEFFKKSDLCFTSLKREIKFLKKQCFFFEKQFENIYTLISRKSKVSE